MSTDPFHVVTGAFGYFGQYIARRLLERGVSVRTLTNSPDRANAFDGKVSASRFHFDDPPRLLESLRGASVLGKLVGDVIITREEIEGPMADLLYVDSPPTGSTKLTDWAEAHADSLGRRYTSELARRRNRRAAYEQL